MVCNAGVARIMFELILSKHRASCNTCFTNSWLMTTMMYSTMSWEEHGANYHQHVLETWYESIPWAPFQCAAINCLLTSTAKKNSALQTKWGNKHSDNSFACMKTWHTENHSTNGHQSTDVKYKMQHISFQVLFVLALAHFCHMIIQSS